jgi:hypothetical protein
MVLLCIIPTGYRTGESNSDAQPWNTGVEELFQTWPPANFSTLPLNNNTAIDTGKERRFLTRGLI